MSNMFKKILSMFSKPKEIEIKLSEVKKKSEEYLKKHVDENVIPLFKEKNSQIKSQISIIEDKSKQLLVANLKNPNIPLKEKQFMTGNRESYIKHVDILLKKLEFPETYKDIKAKYDNFKLVLEEFGKQTMRPRHILKHFFEHETEAVHNEVGKLKKLFDELNDIVNNNLYIAHTDLVENVEKLINSKKIKEQMNSDIKQKEKTIAEKEREIKEKSDELDKLRKSEQFTKFQMMLKERTNIENHISQIKSEIVAMFSRIERAMKKYERIAFHDPDVVREYLHDPFESIENDDGKGNEMFKNIIHTIDKLDLKNKEKILDALIKMSDEDFIKKTKEDIILSKKNLENITNEIKKSDISTKETILSDKIQLEEKSVIEHKKVIEEMKSSLSKMTNDFFMADIEKNLSVILNSNVKII